MLCWHGADPLLFRCTATVQKILLNCTYEVSLIKRWCHSACCSLSGVAIVLLYYLQVRIDRGVDLQSLSTAGLYPCGEGAGYAGGIVSAAVDGMKIAQAIVQDLAINT